MNGHRLLIAFLLAPPHAAQAWDNLGRFFTTPAQRERIDAARFAGIGQVPAQEQGGPQEARGIRRFNGLLVRREGEPRIWMDGARSDAVLRPRLDGSVVLTLEGLRVRLKPGQAVDPVTGRVFEAWELPAPHQSSGASPPGTDEGGTPGGADGVAATDEAAPGGSES